MRDNGGLGRYARAAGAALSLLLVVSAAGAEVRRRVAPVPAPNPAALSRVESCEELRSYVVDAMVEELVRIWLSPWRVLDGVGLAGTQPTDFTTTNTQEAEVDELDLVKTDGAQIYVAMDDTLRVLRSWPAEESALLAAVPLDGWASGLFLRHELVAVLSPGGDPRLGSPFPAGGTRIDLFDVSQPTAPRRVRRIEVEGTLVGARRIGAHLYLVCHRWLPLPEEAWKLLWGPDIGLPPVNWDATPEERQAAAAVARVILRPYVERIVAAMPISDFLPSITDSAWPGGTAPAFPCSSVFRPTQAGSYGMLAVLHLDLDAAAGGSGAVSGVGLLAEGWTVYASSHNLYVANGQPWWWWLDDREATAAIHAFALGGEEPVRYLASGQVPGFLLNQFAMSEHDGLLRVASTEFNLWSPAAEERRGSVVTVLRNDGRGTLAVVGQLGGIAPGERIFAARFLGDKGFLVTFEQVDPLFTLDLADPAHPQLVGKLEMPGFSAYLHPVEDRYLLAVGRAEDGEGHLTELAVNLFDVADLAHPRLVHQHLVARGEGEWTWSEALWDHHAFTFHRGVLSVPLASASRERALSSLAVLEVDPELGIRELGRVDHEDLAPPERWSWMRRSLYVEDFLFSLSTVGIKASLLHEPAQVVARVPFYPLAIVAP